MQILLQSTLDCLYQVLVEYLFHVYDEYIYPGMGYIVEMFRNYLLNGLYYLTLVLYMSAVEMDGIFIVSKSKMKPKEI